MRSEPVVRIVAQFPVRDSRWRPEKGLQTLGASIIAAGGRIQIPMPLWAVFLSRLSYDD